MTKLVRRRKLTSKELSCQNLNEKERLKKLFLLLEKIDKRQKQGVVSEGGLV